MDAEQKRRILDQARATLANRRAHYEPPTEPLLFSTYDPGAREPEPEYEPKLDTTPLPPIDWAAIWNVIDERIEARVQAEREFTLVVVGEALGNAIVEMQKDARQKDASELTKEIAKLQSVCDELRFALSAERGKAIDLPALPLRRSDVN